MLRIARAPGKLNLALELVGRRVDGYHLLAAVSQTIDWSDVLVVELSGDDHQPTIPPRLLTTGPEAPRVPSDDGNIVLRAVAQTSGHWNGQVIRQIGLEKRIPPQSGLGGGSADAAALLRLAKGLPHQDLLAAALSCGADVPFSLAGGAARLGGVGEELIPLPPITKGAFVIAVLGSVSTGNAYRTTTPQDFTDGSRAEAVCISLQQGLVPDPQLFGSGLEAAAVRADPDLGSRAAALRRADRRLWWAMTGSGGAFFTHLLEPEEAVEAAALAAEACPGALIRIAMPLGS